MRPRANQCLLATILALYGAITLSRPALHALPGFEHRSTELASDREAPPGTAIRRTPQPTIARSVISTFRGSLSPILMAPPVWRSCEFDLRTNLSFRPLWPLLGHPARAPRRSLELVRAHARRHYSGFASAEDGTAGGRRPGPLELEAAGTCFTQARRRLSWACIPGHPAGDFGQKRDRGRVPDHSTVGAMTPPGDRDGPLLSLASQPRSLRNTHEIGN